MRHSTRLTAHHRRRRRHQAAAIVQPVRRARSAASISATLWDTARASCCALHSGKMELLCVAALD